MAKLRSEPPFTLADEPVTLTDLATDPGPLNTDALVFEGATVRVVIRPSGTEPKLKCYLESVARTGNRDTATKSLDSLRRWAIGLAG